MSEQDRTQAPKKRQKSRPISKPDNTALHQPLHDDREAWKAYWEKQGQTWRSEPEIDRERQTYLSERRSITPNIEAGIYSFKDIELSRADVEWLLATHENGQGPVVLQDDLQHDRKGLDLRGARLEKQDLRGLPLTRLCAGIAYREDEKPHIAKERICAARINLMGTKLANADLMEAELFGALLSCANLERTNLCKAHLEGADLGKASLKETQLSQAYLKDADLRESCLENIHLEYTNLEHAQLNNATIEGGFMTVTHLQKADLRDVQIRKVDLKYAHLEEADLRQAQIERTYFHGAHFEGAHLEGATLQGCLLIEAHLEEADLHQARLEKVDMSRAHLEGANLVEAFMEGVNLSEAYLERAILVQTNLQNAILIKARMEEARLAGAILKEASLNEVHLEGADLEYAHLEGADLLGAHLEGARCCRTFFDSGTRLNGVILSDEGHGSVSLADISWGNANLSVVKWSQIKMLGDEQMAREKMRDGRMKDKVRILEEYEVAVRTNRQLAVALQAQGLNEVAARFACRAQVLQKSVLFFQMTQSGVTLRQRMQTLGAWLFSWFLFLLAGYGFRPGRSIMAYLIIIFGFMGLFLLNAHFVTPHLRWDEALVLSVSSFHGRGFFSQDISLGDAYARLAAAEAVVGLLIEISFIATFTQRFFGK